VHGAGTGESELEDVEGLPHGLQFIEASEANSMLLIPVSISSRAHYVSLQKYFWHPSLVFFPSSGVTHKTKTGTAYW
jgi:hypothetical protein